MSGTDFYYESMPQVAERLGRTVPGAENKKVFFTNSGTEAIEGAIQAGEIRHQTGPSSSRFTAASTGARWARSR